MHIDAERTIAAGADTVFALVTDPQRLSSWNATIIRTLETPSELYADAQWVVEMRALGQSWSSRSTVRAIDGEARRFTYRSQTDDGNPSYADWTWHVIPSGGGSDVRVAVDIRPVTFWRRVLLARIRARQLRAELRRSLEHLATAAVAADR